MRRIFGSKKSKKYSVAFNSHENKNLLHQESNESNVFESGINESRGFEQEMPFIDLDQILTGTDTQKESLSIGSSSLDHALGTEGNSYSRTLLNQLQEKETLVSDTPGASAVPLNKFEKFNKTVWSPLQYQWLNEPSIENETFPVELENSSEEFVPKNEQESTPTPLKRIHKNLQDTPLAYVNPYLERPEHNKLNLSSRLTPEYQRYQRHFDSVPYDDTPLTRVKLYDFNFEKEPTTSLNPSIRRMHSPLLQQALDSTSSSVENSLKKRINHKNHQINDLSSEHQMFYQPSSTTLNCRFYIPQNLKLLEDESLLLDSDTDLSDPELNLLKIHDNSATSVQETINYRDVFETENIIEKIQEKFPIRRMQEQAPFSRKTYRDLSINPAEQSIHDSLGYQSRYSFYENPKDHESHKNMSAPFTKDSLTNLFGKKSTLDPTFPLILDELLKGIRPIENTRWTKHNESKSILELFNEYVQQEQEKYKDLMKQETDSGKFANITLESLDHETTFVDLQAEIREIPANDVSKAVDGLIRAEIKNKIYEIYHQKNANVHMNSMSEDHRTAFIPEDGGNVEIITYMGTMGKNAGGVHIRKFEQTKAADKINKSELSKKQESPISELHLSSVTNNPNISSSTVLDES